MKTCFVGHFERARHYVSKCILPRVNGSVSPFPGLLRSVVQPGERYRSCAVPDCFRKLRLRLLVFRNDGLNLNGSNFVQRAEVYTHARAARAKGHVVRA